jgi:ABC-type nickel/cobalt efflux system permease component RcnA
MKTVKKLLIVSTILLWPGIACAHPVPKDVHDRFISVRLQDGSKPGQLAVKIVYRLEVDEVTVLLKDMRDYKDQFDPVKLGLQGYYAQYARIYSEIIGRNLFVRVNGGEFITMVCREQGHTLKDETTGLPLGHLRCTFEYTAEFPVKADAVNIMKVRENNFRDLDGQEGQVYFDFVNQAKVDIKEQIVPDPALNKLDRLERPDDFDNKLRNLTIRYYPISGAEPASDAQGKTPPDESKKEPVTRPEPEEASHEHDLFLRTYRELRESNAGLWLILLVFAGLGAAHALTPGHGKTLVAAYLVGEHGTIWHAILLGLVTTITHTGVVLIIAGVLFFLPESMSAEARQSIQTGLGLLLGISVACLGAWLLLQRLAGRADHVHIGGGHDHHHHHGHHSTESGGTPKRRLGLWGIVILGMNGGLIPCWDAVAILATVAGSSDFWLALPALLAFSAGLAAVLVIIGVLVVQVRNFTGSKWGEGAVVRVLPLVSAVVVTCMGLYLCFASMPRTVR